MERFTVVETSNFLNQEGEKGRARKKNLAQSRGDKGRPKDEQSFSREKKRET